jgi:hypothetical protein
VAYYILVDEVKKNYVCLSLFYHVCCLILLLFFRLLRQGLLAKKKKQIMQKVDRKNYWKSVVALGTF